MKTKIFADGADFQSIRELNKNPLIKGFTTNPSLMKKSGIVNYKTFAHTVLSVVKDKPVSFEVFSDDFSQMKRQALEIASWAPNVYVKIPITNTKGEYSEGVIYDLNWSGVKINITAITTIEQIKFIYKKLPYKRGVYISIFAGRIADTGINPLTVMMEAIELVDDEGIEIIWASPREVYNVVQADKIGCHIITCTNDIINKLPLLGKDLKQYSLETVQQFYKDSEGFVF